MQTLLSAWGTLNAEEARVLRSCTVFGAEFSLDAAHTIIGAHAAPAIASLADKHLLVTLSLGRETYVACPADVARFVIAQPDTDPAHLRGVLAAHTEHYLARAAAGLPTDDGNVRTALLRVLNAKIAPLLSREADAERQRVEQAPAQFVAVSIQDDIILITDESCANVRVGGEAIDLSRRVPLRRLLSALVEQRKRAPGVAISTQALIAHVWGEDRLLPDSALNRLRNAIAWLRKLGLGSVIVTLRSGYLLDTRVRIENAQ